MSGDLASQVRAAVALFESFHDRRPRTGEIVRIPGLAVPTVALEVGPQISITYQSLAGKNFEHDFPLASRPHVFVSSDGAQIFTLGGGYRFTDRGFLD